MCGVVGFVAEKMRPELGSIAGRLLRRLEYRGYDSTGAALLSDAPGGGPMAVELRKSVGSPTEVVERLGIERLGGRILCGQVRWATFGRVDDLNAQPHVVTCKVPLVGAHNGNVTNTDEGRERLRRLGHRVVSENDGEMVVHAVEERFAEQLASASETEAGDPRARRRFMRRAIRAACGDLRGSFAAVIVDPAIGVAWAVKRGSSLYFGQDEDESGRFGVASSDLSAVLDFTRRLLPLREGEFVEFDATTAQVFAIEPEDGADEGPLERSFARSRLRARDTALRPPFATFMEQEIHDQPETVGDVVRLFEGGSRRARTLRALLERRSDDERARFFGRLEELRARASRRGIREAVAALETEARALVPEAERALLLDADAPLLSEEAGVLAEVDREGDRRLCALARLADAGFEVEEVAEHELAVERTLRALESTAAGGGAIHALSCGSSYHAALALEEIFDRVAATPLFASLPGSFRAARLASLADGDLVLAISQSGETKDLIDVLDDIERSGRRVARVALVNNVNSTIAQERADVVVPLHCGPEIAVPATKSFLNQLAVGFGLALAWARRRGLPADGVERWARRFRELPDLVRDALAIAPEAIEDAAARLALEPSLHVLGTGLEPIAREAALKIREVVLNHTQGYEAAEFKHGPNTLLGVRTLFGPEQVLAALEADGSPVERLRRAVEQSPRYPLVFVTGPDDRDVERTVSQIHTHEIRGALPVVVARPDERLRLAAGKEAVHLPLPESVADRIDAQFAATVVLQRLALAMSLEKSRRLDGWGVRGHGVHPDVPKNVSKSITVD